MSQTAEKLLTFDEFAALGSNGRFELVNGRLEELVSPRPRHGWTGTRIGIELGPYVDAQEPGCFYGGELDIPTTPFCGRRPDFAYFSPEDAAKHVSPDDDRVTGVPTLVVEIVSPEDEARDLITKRREYAQAGIAHYWILDPRLKTALVLTLAGSAYRVTGKFSGSETLVSELFPGLQIPLSRLFR